MDKIPRLYTSLSPVTLICASSTPVCDLLLVGVSVKSCSHSSFLLLSVNAEFSGLTFQPAGTFKAILPEAPFLNAFNFSCTVCGCCELKIYTEFWTFAVTGGVMSTG